MQVGPGSDGIQQLLQAEAEAQRIIESARKEKAEKLKQAKAEADKELAAYKTERETAYHKKIAEGTSSSGAQSDMLASQTEMEIRAAKESVLLKKKEVVDLLVSHATTVTFKS